MAGASTWWRTRSPFGDNGVPRADRGGVLGDRPEWQANPVWGPLAEFAATATPPDPQDHREPLEPGRPRRARSKLPLIPNGQKARWT